MQDREASEGVMAAPRSGGDKMGARGHDACQLFFPVWGGRYVFLVIGYLMTVARALGFAVHAYANFGTKFL